MAEPLKHSNKPMDGDDKPQSNVDKFIDSLLDDLKHNRLELPTLPQVAAKIHRVIADKSARARDVAQVVGADPALCARLIQVANSPMVRGDRKIENVQMAVTRMGTDMVRNIITSFLVKQLFDTRIKSLQQLMTQIWTHSAHVASISHVLAARFSDIRPDEAMLAGLLHDIGKLPILAKARSLPSVRQNEDALLRVLDRLHCPLGKAILESWKFDEHIIIAAAEHEKLHRNSKQLDHTDIVIIANLHSHMGMPKAKKVDWTKVPAMNKLKLDPETSLGILEEARDEIKEIQNVIMN